MESSESSPNSGGRCLRDVSGAAAVPHHVTLHNVDFKLYGLGQVYVLLGKRAVEAIMLGLSRRLKTSREDVRFLISQWERRDPRCCFGGSVDDLLRLKDTYVLAVSYRHQPEEYWKRKGDEVVSKMADEDQGILTDVVSAFKRIPTLDHVILWCDQIISTRFRGGRINSLGWYNAGLLPYAALPVLKLSPHIPEKELEGRIWIKAERTLGHMGLGVLDSEYASMGNIASFGKSTDARRILQSLAQVILSGYWPEDTGFWAKDYIEMKMWALSMACRGPKRWPHEGLPLFEEVTPVDNLEILTSISEFALPPALSPHGDDTDESPMYTDDPHFYLKATAWNLTLSMVWNEESEVVSHYMGRIGSYCKFTWWIERVTKTIFGFMLINSASRAAIVLAVKDEGCYKVLRTESNPRLYTHADESVGPQVKGMFAEFAHRYGISVDLDQEWNLLYFWEENDDARPENHIKIAFEDDKALCDAVVPHVFLNTTGNLFKVVVATGNGEKDPTVIAEEIKELRDSWNNYIMETFDEYVTVGDTMSGVNWLEGYGAKEVTCGFLDYITRALITGDERFSDVTTPLRSKWEVVQEIHRVAGTTRTDIRILATELYGAISEGNCEDCVELEDVARFMVSGGFSSCFKPWNELLLFLIRTAMKRGGWATVVNSRNGVLQIIFFNMSGDARIAKRRTSAPDFSANGFVRPEDSQRVKTISQQLTEGPENYRSFSFWKEDMKCTCTGTVMRQCFQGSCMDIGQGRTLCLVDMTASRGAEDEEHAVFDVVSGASTARSAEDLMTAKLGPLMPFLNQVLPPEHNIDIGEALGSAITNTDGSMNVNTDRLVDALRRASERRSGLMKRLQKVVGKSPVVSRSVAQTEAGSSASKMVPENCDERQEGDNDMPVL